MQLLGIKLAVAQDVKSINPEHQILTQFQNPYIHGQ